MRNFPPGALLPVLPDGRRNISVPRFLDFTDNIWTINVVLLYNTNFKWYSEFVKKKTKICYNCLNSDYWLNFARVVTLACRLAWFYLADALPRDISMILTYRFVPRYVALVHGRDDSNATWIVFVLTSGPGADGAGKDILIIWRFLPRSTRELRSQGEGRYNGSQINKNN